MTILHCVLYYMFKYIELSRIMIIMFHRTKAAPFGPAQGGVERGSFGSVPKDDQPRAG